MFKDCAFDCSKFLSLSVKKIRFLSPRLFLLDQGTCWTPPQICRFWWQNNLAGNQSLSLSRGGLFPPHPQQASVQNEVGINCLIQWSLPCWDQPTKAAMFAQRKIMHWCPTALGQKSGRNWRIWENCNRNTKRCMQKITRLLALRRLMPTGIFPSICIWRALHRSGAQKQTLLLACFRESSREFSVCVLEKVNDLPCGKLSKYLRYSRRKPKSH